MTKSTLATEYEHIEYKQSLTAMREIVETVAAFATARGGTLHIGIAPDGKRVGVQLGRGTIENLANAIKINTDPPQYPSIMVEGDEASAVIVVRVDECPIKPAGVWSSVQTSRSHEPAPGSGRDQAADGDDGGADVGRSALPWSKRVFKNTFYVTMEAFLT